MDNFFSKNNHLDSQFLLDSEKESEKILNQTTDKMNKNYEFFNDSITQDFLNPHSIRQMIESRRKPIKNWIISQTFNQDFFNQIKCQIPSNLNNSYLSNTIKEIHSPEVFNRLFLDSIERAKLKVYSSNILLNNKRLTKSNSSLYVKRHKNDSIRKEVKIIQHKLVEQRIEKISQEINKCKDKPKISDNSKRLSKRNTRPKEILYNKFDRLEKQRLKNIEIKLEQKENEELNGVTWKPLVLLNR